MVYSFEKMPYMGIKRTSILKAFFYSYLTATQISVKLRLRGIQGLFFPQFL